MDLPVSSSESSFALNYHLENPSAPQLRVHIRRVPAARQVLFL